MPGLLTTHVLDTMHGIPAAGLRVQLWRLNAPGGPRELLKMVRTNENGRTNEPLLQGADLLTGTYELVFAVGAYFAALHLVLPQPPFLDDVPVRFGLAESEAHYHVPLLVSPWAYSTYRGS